MSVVVGSPFGSPFSLAPLTFGEHERSLKRAAAPGQSGPREAIEDSAPDADHEAYGQSAHQTAGRHADAAPVVPIAVAGPGRWRHDRPRPPTRSWIVRTPAIRDQILAAPICALRVAASQRLDERLLLEPLASPANGTGTAPRIIS
jgi:hypothetical protein